MKSAFYHTVVKLTAFIGFSAEALFEFFIRGYYIITPAVSPVENSAHFFIKISPSDTIELPRLDSVEIKCGIYIEGSRQSGNITYTTNYSDEKYYNIKPTLEGYEVTNIMTNPNPLIITFKADNCEDVSVTINLDGFI